MNSERNILKRLLESSKYEDNNSSYKELDEKTYTIGDTQYWKRSGKYYKWTASTGKAEVSEDEYYKVLSSGDSVKNTDPSDDKAKVTRPDIVSPELAKHFDEENARMDSFLKHPKFNEHGDASIEMSNGQIFETMTKPKLISYIKDINSSTTEDNEGNKYLPQDLSVAIKYSDGSTIVLGDSDPIPGGRLKTRGIVAYVEDNSATTVIYGDVKIENYNEILAGEKMTRYGTNEDEDDWRADFI